MKYRPRLTLVRKNAVLCALLSLLVARAAAAQTETNEPFTPPAEWTAARVWSSGGRSYARVNIQFPNGCYSIASVGPVVRQGNDLSVDFAVNRFTGGCILAIIHKEYFFDLGALAPGSYTFTIRARGTAVRSVAFDPSQVVEHWEETSSPETTGIAVWTAGGVTFASVSINFPDDGHRVAEWREPVRAGNDFVTRVRLERWTGSASALAHKGATRLFSLGTLPPDETFTVTVEFSDGVRKSSRPFTPAGQARPSSMHPLDDPAFFVRQHYVDFLGREPDAEGLTFWYEDIVKNCPFSPSPCLDVKRVNVSAAFFLSIESQQTGFYVYRIHKAATGQVVPRLSEFFADTRRTAAGVVVGRENWQAQVEENQRRFAEEFVARAEFKERYPETLTPAQYVDALNRNISQPLNENDPAALSGSERDELIAGLAGGTETRATVLRRLALNEEFTRLEFNRAFVLMQYFGYLRREPDAEGFSFWLSKLDTFRGNFIEAEMVKAFLDSTEYRGRFTAR